MSPSRTATKSASRKNKHRGPAPDAWPFPIGNKTVGLTAEESTAIHWVRQLRRSRGDRRRTINDVLVDALWYFLEHEEGVTKDQIRAMVPVAPLDERARNKVTEMTPKNKR